MLPYLFADIGKSFLKLVGGAQAAVVVLDDGLVQEHFWIVGPGLFNAFQMLQARLVVFLLVLGQRLLG